MRAKDKNISYVYSHTRIDTNQIFYIGVGTGRNYYRSREKERRNEHWNRIVNKTDYLINILFDNLSFEDACKKEIELISLYGRVNNNTGILCNQTDGGDGTKGVIVKEETKSKLKGLNLGRKATKEERLLKSINGVIGWEKRRLTNKTISNNKPILCLNNSKEYISAGKAAKELGLSCGNISMVVNG
jgi:hypothetical protein